ncbi:MAG: hypothetical protein AAGA90_15685 [Actinomycetota bacterium]
MGGERLGCSARSSVELVGQVDQLGGELSALIRFLESSIRKPLTSVDDRHDALLVS